MEFYFKLQKQDYLTHQLYVANHTPFILYKQETLKWLFSLIYVGLGVLFFVNSFALWQGAVFILLGVVWFVYFPILYKKRYKKSYGRLIDENFKEVLEKKIAIKIDKQFIKTGNGESEASVEVSELDSLIELKELFLLNLVSGMTLIIPKREVVDVHNFLSFFSEIGVRHNKKVDWEWK